MAIKSCLRLMCICALVGVIGAQELVVHVTYFADSMCTYTTPNTVQTYNNQMFVLSVDGNCRETLSRAPGWPGPFLYNNARIENGELHLENYRYLHSLSPDPSAEEPDPATLTCDHYSANTGSYERGNFTYRMDFCDAKNLNSNTFRAAFRGTSTDQLDIPSFAFDRRVAVGVEEVAGTGAGGWGGNRRLLADGVTPRTFTPLDPRGELTVEELLFNLNTLTTTVSELGKKLVEVEKRAKNAEGGDPLTVHAFWMAIVALILCIAQGGLLLASLPWLENKNADSSSGNSNKEQAGFPGVQYFRVPA